MATDSSILAWRIPWTEESGEVQSIESAELNVTEDLTAHRLRRDKMLPEK